MTLPATREYTIRVYLMGNDKDAGNSVSKAWMRMYSCT